MVRALASHQCGPGSNPGVDVIMWVEFVVGSLSCSERFSPGTPVFPFPKKNNISKFQFDLERTDSFQRVVMNSYSCKCSLGMQISITIQDSACTQIVPR